ncbi:MAG TPA: biotin/lipoyl-binding protein [Eoetvoesiella sp.]
MKIRFDSSKERHPTHERGLKVLYAPGRRMAFRLRWYLILVLIASPLLWFVGKLTYSAWVVDAPGHVQLSVVEIRARDAARISLLTVKSNDHVQRGQLLVKMDNPDWQQRLGQLQALHDKSSVAEQPVEQKLREVLQRQLAAAEHQLMLATTLLKRGAATNGEIRSATAQRDQRQNELLSFEQRTDQLHNHPGNSHNIALENAEKQWLQERLRTLNVTAQDEGVISDILVNEGENVGPGTLLMRLEQNSRPIIWVYLDPANVAYAQPGQSLKVGFPDGSWLPAKVHSNPDRTRRLPEELRVPFSASQRGLVVSVMLDVKFPEQWLIDQLPIEARFHRDLSLLWKANAAEAQ